MGSTLGSITDSIISCKVAEGLKLFTFADKATPACLTAAAASGCGLQPDAIASSATRGMEINWRCMICSTDFKKLLLQKLICDKAIK
jgi:hypothetical protein